LDRSEELPDEIQNREFTHCSRNGDVARDARPGSVRLRLGGRRTAGNLTRADRKRTHHLPKEVGLLLEPASGEVFAKNFFAGANAVGGLIGETTPANSFKKSVTLKYTSSGSKQLPTEFEGEVAEHYLTAGEVKAPWGASSSMTLSHFSKGGKEMEVELIAWAPTVVTKAASGVEATKATVNGTVDPEGLATKYYFQYGTSTSYGSLTSEASAGEGTSAVAESAKLTGLTAGTTYHFRVVATNAAGTSYGSE
jgi:hypothetical protein